MCLEEQPSAGRKQDFKRLLYILKKNKGFARSLTLYILIESPVNHSSTS
jgi:hypothetical protein